MNDRLRKFEAALIERDSDLTLETLAASLRVDGPTLEAYITEGGQLGAMAEGVLTGLMGSSLEEFLEPAGEPSTPAPGRPESDLETLLTQARQIMEGGGEKAAALRTILKALRG